MSVKLGVPKVLGKTLQGAASIHPRKEIWYLDELLQFFDPLFLSDHISQWEC